MNTTTSRQGHHAARAAAIASTAAFIFAAAACGTETGSDGSPAAPGPAPQALIAAHPPVSADAAERRGASQRHELKLRRSHMQAPSGRDIPLN